MGSSLVYMHVICQRIRHARTKKTAPTAHCTTPPPGRRERHLQVPHRGSCRPPVSLSSCVDARLCWWHRWGSAPLRCSLKQRQRQLTTDRRRRRRQRRRCGASAVAEWEIALTVADDVEGAGHRFAGRVVASAHAALVPPCFGVEHVVAAGLLQGRVKDKESKRIKNK